MGVKWMGEPYILRVFDPKSVNFSSTLISDRFKPDNVVRLFYKESSHGVSFGIEVQHDAQNDVKLVSSFSKISVCPNRRATLKLAHQIRYKN